MRTLREWALRALGTLERAADAAPRRGQTPDGAVREAGIRAGGVSQAMDALRDQRGLPSVDALVRDLRFAARMLTKDRWITLAAVGHARDDDERRRRARGAGTIPRVSSPYSARCVSIRPPCCGPSDYPEFACVAYVARVANTTEPWG